eukprot:Pgem_evm1s2455
MDIVFGVKNGKEVNELMDLIGRDVIEPYIKNDPKLYEASLRQRLGDKVYDDYLLGTDAAKLDVTEAFEEMKQEKLLERVKEILTGRRGLDILAESPIQEHLIIKKAITDLWQSGKRGQAISRSIRGGYKSYAKILKFRIQQSSALLGVFKRITRNTAARSMDHLANDELFETVWTHALPDFKKGFSEQMQTKGTWQNRLHERSPKTAEFIRDKIYGSQESWKKYFRDMVFKDQEALEMSIKLEKNSKELNRKMWLLRQKKVFNYGALVGNRLKMLITSILKPLGTATLDAFNSMWAFLQGKASKFRPEKALSEMTIEELESMSEVNKVLYYLFGGKESSVEKALGKLNGEKYQKQIQELISDQKDVKIVQDSLKQSMDEVRLMEDGRKKFEAHANKVAQAVLNAAGGLVKFGGETVIMADNFARYVEEAEKAGLLDVLKEGKLDFTTAAAVFDLAANAAKAA